MKVFILFALAVAAACAEDKATADITDKQRADFWMLYAESESAQHSADKAAESLRQKKAELEKTCADAGMKFSQRQDGHPFCAVKPASK